MKGPIDPPAVITSGLLGRDGPRTSAAFCLAIQDTALFRAADQPDGLVGAVRKAAPARSAVLDFRHPLTKEPGLLDHQSCVPADKRAWSTRSPELCPRC